MLHGKTSSRLFGKMGLLLLVAIAGIALAAPAVAQHKDNPTQVRAKKKLTVMTRNVYLGADLTPAIEAQSLGEAIDAAGVIVNELDSTKFPDRAVPLAEEIKKAKPDLVGLQEVALWRDQTPSDLGAPPINPNGIPATNVRYDFLALLRQELKDAGAKYRVVDSQQEFDAELPADTDGSNDTGGFEGADIDARLTMRDVILARKDSDVKLGKVRMAHFDTRFEPTIAGSIVVPVDRGWLSVEAKLDDDKFRFVNTHLEAFGDPTIREAQAKELFAKGGPLRTKKQVILVGDINSGLPNPHNVGNLPGQDPDDPLAFKALKKFGMKDRGAIQSCCYSDMFDESLVFDHTVDHVLTKPGLKSKKAFITGDDVSERTPSDLWPSDHGGVVSKLLLPR